MAYSALRKLGTYASAGLITGLTALCLEVSAGDIKFKSSTKSLPHTYAEQKESVNIGGKDLYVSKTPEGYKIKLTAGDSNLAIQGFHFYAVAGTITEQVEKETKSTHKETYSPARLHYDDASKKLEVVAAEKDLETVRIPLAPSVTIPKDKLREYQEKNKKLELKTISIGGKEFYVLPTAHFTPDSLSSIAQTGIVNELLMPTEPTAFIPRTEALADGSIKMTEFLAGRVYALMPAELEEVKTEATPVADNPANPANPESGAKEEKKK